MDIILGKPRRRWSREDKAAIVAESYAPGATVADVARRHGLVRPQLSAWRRELGAAARAARPLRGFAPVMLAPPAEARPPEPAVDVPPSSAPAFTSATIEIDLPRGGHVRIIGAVEAKLAAAVLTALVKR